MFLRTRARVAQVSVCAAVLIVSLLIWGCSSLQVSQVYSRGALVTAAPIATEVGQAIFQKGGNSFDVAVAVGFTLAVVHPQAGNIGGGGFALVRHGESGEITALDFRETAPASSSEDMFLDDTGKVVAGLSVQGALASGVPGTVAGLYALWEKYGTLPFGELVSPAIALADTGFVLDAYLAKSLSLHSKSLNSYEETATIFFPGGRSLKEGDRLIQKDLASTLLRIVEEGPAGFYDGETAQKIVACMEKHDGLITASDLLAYRVIWRDPTHVVFDSLDIYSMPPPSSGGIAVGQILKLLEPYDLSTEFPDSPKYIHLFCEASRLAFADRSVHLGDPAFYDVPSTLLNAQYLNRRRSLIDVDHAQSIGSFEAGSPLTPESDETTHYSICDDSGNMVAITYTLNTSYGSKLVVGDAGFLLNNEMDDFSLKPGVPNTFGLIGAEANKIEPSKRMLSSMSPTLIMDHGKPYAVLGSPGGSKIITTVAQAIMNLTRFQLTPLETVNQPRFHHQWRPDSLYLEAASYDINIVQDLIRRGHNVTERSAYGNLQLISIDDVGMMIPAADPRHRGLAGGVK